MKVSFNNNKKLGQCLKNENFYVQSDASDWSAVQMIFSQPYNDTCYTTIQPYLLYNHTTILAIQQYNVTYYTTIAYNDTSYRCTAGQR